MSTLQLRVNSLNGGSQLGAVYVNVKWFTKTFRKNKNLRKYERILQYMIK